MEIKYGFLFKGGVLTVKAPISGIHGHILTLTGWQLNGNCQPSNSGIVLSGATTAIGSKHHNNHLGAPWPPHEFICSNWKPCFSLEEKKQRERESVCVWMGGSFVQMTLCEIALVRVPALK